MWADEQKKSYLSRETAFSSNVYLIVMMFALCANCAPRYFPFRANVSSVMFVLLPPH